MLFLFALSHLLLPFVANSFYTASSSFTLAIWAIAHLVHLSRSGIAPPQFQIAAWPYPDLGFLRPERQISRSKMAKGYLGKTGTVLFSIACCIFATLNCVAALAGIGRPSTHSIYDAN